MNDIINEIDRVRNNWNMTSVERGDKLFDMAKHSNSLSDQYQLVSNAISEYEIARGRGNIECLCNLAHCYFVMAHWRPDISNEYYRRSIELHIEGSRSNNYLNLEFYRFYKVSNIRQTKSILKYIMLSSPSKFNDPLDSPIAQDQNTRNLFPDKSIFDGLKVCCFGEENTLGNKKKVFPTDSKKWAYYGDDHRGICISYHFLPNQLEKTLSNRFVFKKVNYKYRFSFDRGIVADGLLSKSKQYEEEQEWRLVWYDRNCSNNKYYKSQKECVLMPINAKNITAIYVGYRCPEEIVQTIIEFANKNKTIPLHVYKTHPDSKNLFRMTLTKIY